MHHHHLALHLILLYTIHALDNTIHNSITAEKVVSECSSYSDLYQTIDEDLATWNVSGISEELTVRAIDKWTNRAREKGFAVAFLEGVAYVIDFE